MISNDSATKRYHWFCFPAWFVFLLNLGYLFSQNTLFFELFKKKRDKPKVIIFQKCDKFWFGWADIEKSSNLSFFEIFLSPKILSFASFLSAALPDQNHIIGIIIMRDLNFRHFCCVYIENYLFCVLTFFVADIDQISWLLRKVIS